MYRVQSRESRGFRASMGAHGACLGALGRVLGVLFGPLGSRGASFAALRLSSGALGWVLELPRGSFWSSRGLSGGSRKTKDEQEATIRHAKFYFPKFFLQIRRQYSTFPSFFESSKGQNPITSGRPGGMLGPGEGPWEGSGEKRTDRFGKNLL